jgi:phosphoribosylamine--glycine ligase
VGDLREEHISWKEEACMTVVLTSGGYPGYYKKGHRIYGLPYPDEDILVFHNGTKRERDHFVTNGGRVLSVTCTGQMDLARERIYQAIEEISFVDMGYRRDIGLFK